MTTFLPRPSYSQSKITQISLFFLHVRISHLLVPLPYNPAYTFSFLFFFLLLFIYFFDLCVWIWISFLSLSLSVRLNEFVFYPCHYEAPAVFRSVFGKCHFLFKYRHSFQLQKGYVYIHHSDRIHEHFLFIYRQYYSTDSMLLLFYPVYFSLSIFYISFKSLLFFLFSFIWTGWEVKRKW